MQQTCVIAVLVYFTITSQEPYRRAQRFHEQKPWRNEQSRPQRFPVQHHANKSGLNLGFVK